MIQLCGLRSSNAGQSEPEAALHASTKPLVTQELTDKTFPYSADLHSLVCFRATSTQEIGPEWWINDLFINVRYRQLMVLDG